MEVGERTPSGRNSCRKSEIELSLPYEQFVLSAMRSRSSTVSTALPRRQQREEKTFQRSIPRNPLISLNSDERIRRKSKEIKPQKSGVFAAKSAKAQENPNRAGRTDLRRVAAKESQTASIQMQSDLADAGAHQSGRDVLASSGRQDLFARDGRVGVEPINERARRSRAPWLESSRASAGRAP